MAFRFQRRIRIAPGVRLNLSKGGLGLSAGPRGMSHSVGPRGAYRNIGLPGTGLSYRKKIGARGKGVTPRGAASAKVPTRFQLSFEEDGKAVISGPEGEELPAATVKRIRDSNRAIIGEKLDDAARTMNATLDALLAIHHETPAPVFQTEVVSTTVGPRPAKPNPRRVGFFDRLLGRRALIERQNQEDVKAWGEATASWHAAVAAQEEEAQAVAELNAAVHRGDMAACEEMLDRRLSALTWSKETEVSFDLGDDFRTLAMDIDLPTWEEIPDKEYSVLTRGLGLRIKKRSDTQRRKDFAYVAHATLFRVTGEAFAAIPGLEQVTISGFTQAPDARTGNTRDMYILSASIPRETWADINFDRLDDLDPIEAFTRFELVREMTRGGQLKEIQPLG